ncbi:MAG TPA: sugar phosphate isomerase/epimerase [Chloroflexota bacterium]|nr:sugar phosphate isomerase/epimerase [Chloroflexota bacterium]
MKRLPVALQLYSVRDQLKEDFRRVVHKVAEIGYDGVQFAGYGGLSAQEMRSLLGEAGVQPAGTHTGLNILEGSLDQEIDYNLEIGNKWIICPSLPEARRKDIEGWREIAASLNRIGERCRDRGLLFGYHNHAFEFPQITDAPPGERGIDVLLGQTDGELVFWEPDVYWIHKGGEDPVTMIRQYADRVPITHLKDETKDERKTFAEVGEGSLDFNAILDASEEAGVEWHCVEQDRCDRDPLESVAISLHNLHRMGMGLKSK